MPAKRPRVADVHGRWENDARVVFLLDVNVLIALTDPAHTFHARAHAWFQRTGKRAWATCPLTENGALRIMGQARYPLGPGSPVAVVSLLAHTFAAAGHQFWPDDVSLFDTDLVDGGQLLSSAQLTDTYLLALAVQHGGKLATFDRHLVTTAVKHGKAALCVID